MRASNVIDLDYPFHMDERASRIQFARDAIDNPDVSIAEKFRQVLVMYQTETSYGRTMRHTLKLSLLMA